MQLLCAPCGKEIAREKLCQSEAHPWLPNICVNWKFYSYLPTPIWPLFGQLGWDYGVKNGPTNLIRLLYTLQAYFAPFGHKTKRDRWQTDVAIGIRWIVCSRNVGVKMSKLKENKQLVCGICETFCMASSCGKEILRNSSSSSLLDATLRCGACAEINKE